MVAVCNRIAYISVRAILLRAYRRDSDMSVPRPDAYRQQGGSLPVCCRQGLIVVHAQVIAKPHHCSNTCVLVLAICVSNQLFYMHLSLTL